MGEKDGLMLNRHLLRGTDCNLQSVLVAAENQDDI